MRGTIEERAEATTFLAQAFEQAPIHYHERLHGFAENSDTRVPVAEPLGLAHGSRRQAGRFQRVRPPKRAARSIFVRACSSAHTRWTLDSGAAIEVATERLVPIDGSPVLLRRLRATAGERPVSIAPHLAPAPHAASQSDDPRIGVNLGSGGFVTERADDDVVVERLPGSGIGVAAVQRTREDDGWLLVATGFAVGTEPSAHLVERATALADTWIAAGFESALEIQRAALATFWDRAALAIGGRGAHDRDAPPEPVPPLPIRRAGRPCQRRRQGPDRRRL